jgi:chemotaxis methyl-accepting protein methylase
VNSTETATRLLETRPHLIPGAVSALLIGVSHFFRDASVFECVRSFVLPELLGCRPAIRAYSAGASDGQELYSIGMLLDLAGALERSELLGVDCRTDAVAKARSGLFESSELQGLPAEWKSRFFRPSGKHYTIESKVRSRSQWRVDDLLRFDSGGEMDLILFRNVAIYLNGAHASRAWRHLSSQLGSGGFLITGKAEIPDGGVALERIAPSVYRRR